ncbi:NADP-dependent oxidoreductase [Actinosynnema pretiosum subsp. pretiosum]|uniref:Alcohol dehydrogenase GroES domain protein n=2 Tax=Actinosynnema TaxID=40566 RepID=C6WHB4_ACTMD|nr:NADP-dependent oxidoreductase [Actinosynnema mirum]ACU38033.1 Alcohol dehydrogenase GroES domain protein [Actinosynnema mirum DSM 43827]AXX31525.1 oxidoreductase [Actinosynnema pretiosum subsp. pretiosum]QUF04440.1 NADP-dependent oxidoreductase [Actinosynnema pretiosum subsp. pretiosum]
MRAARYHEYGPADVLTVDDDVVEPHAGPGEVRIAVGAASVNPVDWKVRAGYLRKLFDLPVEQQPPGIAAFAIDLPAIPGRDAAGVVDEVGEGVTGVAVGDLVFGLGGLGGATAEHAVLSAWARVPSTWTVEQAAAAGLAVVTAGGALDALGDVKGRTVLVEGAAGGVGSAAVRLAVARGAAVIGTAGERNHAYLAELGATPTTYGEGLAERVAALGGADLVVDAAGSGSLADLVAIAGGPDAVVTVADQVNAPALGVRSLGAENNPALLAEAAELGERGGYAPHVSRVFGLEEVAQAHAHVEEGHVRGKVVVRI